VIENDRHELLFGEVSVKGTAGRNTWSRARRRSAMPTARSMSRALLTRLCSHKTISALLPG
jgi:hypothetical protein